MKTKTLKKNIATTSASSMPASCALPKVLEMEEQYKFYTMADSNATSALETFGKRLNELSEIVAILGGTSADIKMKEWPEVW